MQRKLTSEEKKRYYSVLHPNLVKALPFADALFTIGRLVGVSGVDQDAVSRSVEYCKEQINGLLSVKIRPPQPSDNSYCPTCGEPLTRHYCKEVNCPVILECIGKGHNICADKDGRPT